MVANLLIFFKMLQYINQIKVQFSPNVEEKIIQLSATYDEIQAYIWSYSGTSL